MGGAGRCDQTGLWGPLVLNVSPPWLEPSCKPRDGSTRCAFGSEHPRLHIPVPCYCHRLLLSFLGTFNEQLGWGRRIAFSTLSSLDTRKTAGCPISEHPVLGKDVWGFAGQAAVLPCHTALGHGRALGMAGHGLALGAGSCPRQRFGKCGMAVPTRHHLAGRAAPLPHPHPSGGQSGHVAAGRLALPGAGAAALPSCSGHVPRLAGAGAAERRPWQGFSSRLSSLAVLGWLCPTQGPGLSTP